MSGTLAFAFVAGTVATANPCGFALLPAYLARRVGATDEPRSGAEALSRALLVGLVTTAGFMLVFGTLGTAIALGARSLIGVLPWAGLAIGTALALAGLAVLSGRRIRLRLPDARRRAPRSGLRADLLFGIGYGTASLSCTLPVFLAAIGTAVTGGLPESAASFLAYAAGMGTILTALAVAAALSRRGLALAVRRLVLYVHRASGALLLAAGAYVVYYWAFFLLPGSERREAGRDVIARGQAISTELATWIGSPTGKLTASVLLASTAALGVWALVRRLAKRTPDRPARRSAGPAPIRIETSRRAGR